MSRARVAVAMSGGVDSSAAAAILKGQGFEVVGFSMQLFDQRRGEAAGDAPRAGGCCSLDDLYDARRVAAHLGIPHYIVNFEAEFESRVVRAFVRDYRNGLTPSPCILCNSTMKFDHLMKLAGQVGASHIATGHYARIMRSGEPGRFGLLKGKDPEKDQSYFLFELRQDQLAGAMFPLGDLDKSEVRRIAGSCGLDVAEKAESQEICFVPDGDYASFVERYVRNQEGADETMDGEIVDREGRVIGTHRGIHHFTIGQRRGMGIAHSSPLYVTEIRPRERRIVVGERPDLARRIFLAERANWLSVSEPSRPFQACVKIRSRHPEAPAWITPTANGTVRVEFDTPQNAITPGQAAVFYDGESVLGGAWIRSVE